MDQKHFRTRRRLPWWWRVLRFLLATALAFYLCVTLALLALKRFDPRTTAVQAERRVESWFAKGKYQKRYTFIPLRKISLHLQHAVIAAEDGRFYSHHGFDWDELQVAVKEDLKGGRVRGASTISQQLVKNLFLTTRGSFLRKGLEFTIVPLEETILDKQRILELYLNVIEMGPGVFGAEAAAQHHFHISAAHLDRDQSARLAAILPAPRRWRPAHMDNYSAIIEQRMALLGW